MERRDGGTYSTVYKYDSIGRQTSQITVFEKAGVTKSISQMICRYAKGSITEQTIDNYYHAELPTAKKIYTLGDKNQPTKIEDFGQIYPPSAVAAKPESRIEISYNSDGSALYTFVDLRSERPQVAQQLSYSKDGWPIDGKYFQSPEPTVANFIYKKDSLGNWTSLEVTISREIMYIITRTITYEK